MATLNQLVKTVRARIAADEGIDVIDKDQINRWKNNSEVMRPATVFYDKNQWDAVKSYFVENKIRYDALNLPTRAGVEVTTDGVHLLELATLSYILSISDGKYKPNRSPW